MFIKKIMSNTERQFKTLKTEILFVKVPHYNYRIKRLKATAHRLESSVLSTDLLQLHIFLKPIFCTEDCEKLIFRDEA